MEYLIKNTIDDVSKFANEFSSFLISIKNMKRSTFISGDFNVNLLSVNSKRHFFRGIHEFGHRCTNLSIPTPWTTGCDPWTSECDPLDY